MGPTPRKVTCGHPRRRHRALGMCNACYSRWFTWRMTPEQYRTLLDQQRGRCAICHRRPDKRTLHIDHSHITGLIRGLVCGGCNRDVLGPIDGNPEYIQQTIDFLYAMLSDLLAHRLAGLPDTNVARLPPALVEPGGEA